MIFLSGLVPIASGVALVATGLTALLADTTSDLANTAAWFGVLATGITLLIVAVWKGMAQGMRMWLEARSGTDRELLMKVQDDNKECEAARKELTEALHLVKTEFIAYKTSEARRINDLEMRLDEVHGMLVGVGKVVLENRGWIAHKEIEAAKGSNTP